MTANGLIQLALYIIVLLLLVKPLGAYMANVYEGRSLVNRAFGGVERGSYRLFGVRPDDEMTWKTYAVAVLLFNALGVIVVYALQRLQGVLPLNPAQLPATTPDLAFNTG